MHTLKALSAAILFGVPMVAGAQVAGNSETETAARIQRNGAGLRAGVWNVRDLAPAAGNSSQRSPLFEGYFQKGLDLHLALENTLSVWRWHQSGTRTQGGGLLGGSTTTTETVDAYVVPFFTSLKLFPFTKPRARLEPYVLGGAGLGLGIEDRSSDNASLLYGGSTSNPPTIVTGFGFKGGTGVEWRVSRAFGLTVGARYQWMRFFGGQLAGRETYQGLALDGGLVYRYQYR